MVEVSPGWQPLGLPWTATSRGARHSKTLADAAQAAVEAVGPHGANYTALILHFESADREVPFGRHGLTVLVRVTRVDEHGAPTQVV